MHQRHIFGVNIILLLHFHRLVRFRSSCECADVVDETRCVFVVGSSDVVEWPRRCFFSFYSANDMMYCHQAASFYCFHSMQQTTKNTFFNKKQKVPADILKKFIYSSTQFRESVGSGFRAFATIQTLQFPIIKKCHTISRIS